MQFTEFVIPPSTLGAATGYIVNLNNTLWWKLLSGFVHVTTSSTPGWRAITLVLKDAAQHPLWRCNAAALQPADNITGYCVGGGVPFSPTAQQNMIYWPASTDLWLPPNSNLRVLDLDNIDPADQITDINFIFGA